MDVSRRTVLAGMGSLALSATAPRAFALDELSLGPKTIRSVFDGSLTIPGNMYFDGLAASEVEAVLDGFQMKRDMVSPPCNLTLLQQGNDTILFDAGSGPGFMDSAGHMLDALDALVISGEDITHVVFTHAHPDHLWGVLDDFDDLVFANAKHMIGRAEWDYWRDPNTVDNIGQDRAAFAVGAVRRLDAIEDQITLFDDGDEILSGVLAFGTPGHTPGHMSFEVREGAGSVFVTGDAIGNHHVAFARPSWRSAMDQDGDIAAGTRVRLLDKLSTEKTPILGFHLPNGGLGRVEATGDGYQFVEEL